MMNERLSNDDAKREILRRLTGGKVFMSSHFRRAAIADGVLPAQAPQLLVAGFVQMSELEGGSWRYRVRNGRVTLVVALNGEDQLDLVTFFKK